MTRNVNYAIVLLLCALSLASAAHARRYDPETGLMYFRNRMFDTGLGRFVGRDPIGYADGLSLYGGYFVPKRRDPFGTEAGNPLGLLTDAMNVMPDMVRQAKKDMERVRSKNRAEIWDAWVLLCCNDLMGTRASMDHVSNFSMHEINGNIKPGLDPATNSLDATVSVAWVYEEVYYLECRCGDEFRGSTYERDFQSGDVADRKVKSSVPAGRANENEFLRYKDALFPYMPSSPLKKSFGVR